MAWFDDEISMAASSPDLADQYAQYGQGKVGLDNTGLSSDDFAEALGIALGDNAAQGWVQQAFGGITNTAAYAQRQGIGEAPRAESEKIPDKNKAEGGLLGRITDFVDKNKSLSEMLIKGVTGAAAGNQAKKTAQLQAQSSMDELKMRNQQQQEANARTSASIAGLRQPTGILNRGILKRTDGTPVYQNGRIV